MRAGKIGRCPPHLRDAHYGGAKDLGHGKGYAYPHDEPYGVAEQQYLPDVLADATYYRPPPRRGGRGQGALGARTPHRSRLVGTGEA